MLHFLQFVQTRLHQQQFFEIEHPHPVIGGWVVPIPDSEVELEGIRPFFGGFGEQRGDEVYQIPSVVPLNRLRVLLDHEIGQSLDSRLFVRVLQRGQVVEDAA